LPESNNEIGDEILCVLLQSAVGGNLMSLDTITIVSFSQPSVTVRASMRVYRDQSSDPQRQNRIDRAALVVFSSSYALALWGDVGGV
jgi:hypothetical protein